MRSHPPAWRRGDAITEERLNQMQKQIDHLSRLSATYPLELFHGASGPVVRMSREQRIRYVQLTEDLDNGQTVEEPADGATANWLIRDYTNKRWNEGSSPQQAIGLIEPMEDAGGDAGPYLDNTRMPIVFDPDTGLLLPLWAPGPYYGEVDEPAHIAPNAVGTVKIYSAFDTQVTGPLTRECRNRTGLHVWQESEVEIEWRPAPGEWAIVQSNSCTRLRGQLVGAMADTDATISVDNLIAMDKDHYPIASAATTITASNIHSWDGDDNAAARAEWNETDDQWELYQIDCPA